MKNSPGRQIIDNTSTICARMHVATIAKTTDFTPAIKYSPGAHSGDHRGQRDSCRLCCKILSRTRFCHTLLSVCSITQHTSTIHESSKPIHLSNQSCQGSILPIPTSDLLQELHTRKSQKKALPANTHPKPNFSAARETRTPKTNGQYTLED